MGAEVKILVEGYTNSDSVAEMGEERTRPTITLVRDGDITMVVDPGVLESQQVLIDALKEENLTVEDIDIVCVTHSHIDHYRNIGMFPNAKTLEYFGLWSKQTVDNWSENFTDNIKILHTPGHDYTGITLFVKTNEGLVAICGDIFWKENYPQDPKDDAFASNTDKLTDSRKMIVRTADWIIPGHGPIYKNNKDAEQIEEEKSVIKSRESKIVVICKKCGRQMKQGDKCQCRPYLCFKCCECCLDCDNCSCSHKR
jgi:glyoxylase-like metal-dependent hydrolase (beta-lactamase superfamily II)